MPSNPESLVKIPSKAFARSAMPYTILIANPSYDVIAQIPFLPEQKV